MKKNNTDNFKFDLQLFADKEESFEDKVLAFLEAGGKTEEDTGTPEEGTPEEGTLEEDTPKEGTPEEGEEVSEKASKEDESAQPTEKGAGVVEKLHKAGLDKFKDEDAFIKSYIEMEKMNSKNREEVKELKQENEELKQTVNEIFKRLEGGEGEQEEEEEDPSEFMELFYTNPKEALRQVIEETVTPQIQPIVQRIDMEDRSTEFMNKLAAFEQEHPDLPEYSEQMAEIMRENPELRDHPNGIEIMYNMAKGMNATVQDPKELLNDEEFLSQYVLSNDDIKKQIIEEYLQQVQEGAPPATIGSQPAGSTAMTPPKRPKNLQEAEDMALEMFKKQR